MNVGHTGLDVLPELELLATLADLDGAQFARPLVDVLEEMAMDGAQMGQVEGAAGDRPASAQNNENSAPACRETPDR